MTTGVTEEDNTYVCKNYHNSQFWSQLQRFLICLDSLAHYHLAKMLLQTLCIQQVSWDDPLSGKQLTKWRTILLQLCCLNNVQVPRCHFSGDPSTRQLHGFCNTSDRALAALVYLCSIYDNGCVKTVLVVSKINVAVMKRQSIPHLELLGAVTLSQLMATSWLHYLNLYQPFIGQTHIG